MNSFHSGFFKDFHGLSSGAIIGSHAGGRPRRRQDTGCHLLMPREKRNKPAVSIMLVLVLGLSTHALAAADTAGPAASKKAPASDDVVEVADVKDMSKVGKFDSDSWSDPEQFPRIDRVINLMTTQPVRKMSLLAIIDHRAYESLKDNTWKDFFGLDFGSLKIGLGLRFGIIDDLDFGIYRINGTKEVFDTYQFDFKFRFLNQEKHYISMALRAGVDWFYQPSAEDAFGYFGQLMTDYLVAKRWLIGAVVAFHSNSSNDHKSMADVHYSLAVGLYSELRIASFVAWDLETMYAVYGYGEAYPSFSTALKFITNRHTFSLVFSTTQYITADGIVTNTWRDVSNCIIGFTITREFNF